MDPGTAWRAPGCDDRGWESGPAQLDFGDGDEATVVRQSPDGAVPISAAYFRHALVLTNAGAVLSLEPVPKVAFFKKQPALEP